MVPAFISVIATFGVLVTWMLRSVLLETAGGVKLSFAMISSLNVVTDSVSRKVTVSTMPER